MKRLIATVALAVLAWLAVWDGLLQAESWPDPDVPSVVIGPVDCATFTPPVVAYDSSKDQPAANVQSFLSDLIFDGFSVGTISRPIPACVDVLIVRSLSGTFGLPSPYTAGEAAAIKAWVDGGHALLLLGEWGPYAANTEAIFEAFGQAQGGPAALTDPSDYDPTGGTDWVIYQTDNFAPHSIVEGAVWIELLRGSWISPTASAVITSDADANPPRMPVMAAFDSNQGCVVMVTDSDWVANTTLLPNSGYFKRDNALVARQAVSWLQGCGQAPTARPGGPYVVNEGSNITLDGSTSSDPTGDPLIFAWDLDNDLQFDDAFVVNPVFSAALRDNGAYTVSLRVSDGVYTDTGSTRVTVLNVAPTVFLSATAFNVDVGAPITFTGSFIDPGVLDTHTQRWIFGDGTPQVFGLLIRSHTFNITGTFTVSLTVTDDDGGSGSAAVMINVSATPLIANAGGPYAVSEGNSIMLNGSGSIGAAAYAWDLDDDGQFDDAAIPNPIFSAALLDDGAYPVTLRVSNGFITQTAAGSVTVINVAPQVSLAASTLAITVGQPITFTGAFTDPGVLDTHSVQWDFGDGSPPLVGQLIRSHIFSAIGAFTTLLIVNDDDGGAGQAATTISVVALPLAANAGGPYVVNEGSSIVLDGSGSIGAASYAWDLDDDGQFDDAAIANPIFSAALLDDGAYPVSLRVSNGFVTQTAVGTVTVLNVAPQVSLTASPLAVTVGQAITFSGAFTDPGVLDMHTIQWDFGDGSPPLAAQLIRTHVFNTVGNLTTTLTVIDDDGGSGLAAVAVTVAPPPLAAHAGGPYAVNEGSSIALDGSGSIGAASYSWDLNDDGQFDDGAIPTPIFSAAWRDDGHYPVALQVTNHFLTVTASSTVQVLNVAPVVSLTASAQQVETGTPVSSTGSYSDPGVLDTHTPQWNFGDGSTVVTGQLTRAHAFTTAGQYTITLSVTDDDGGTGQAALAIMVVVPPSIPTSVYLPIVARNYCAPVAQNADIVLALDTSGSMNLATTSGGPTKLAAAKAAATHFLDRLIFPGDQAALVAYDDVAALEHMLSDSRSTLITTLQALEASGITRMDLGLAVSRNELTSLRHRPENSRAIVFLTDGRPNGTTEEEVLNQAALTKAAGITIYTIGLGDDVNDVLLQQMASSPDRFYYSPTTEQLTGIYERIVGVVRCR
jgi:PKD repeat protein